MYHVSVTSAAEMIDALGLIDCEYADFILAPSGGYFVLNSVEHFCYYPLQIAVSPGESELSFRISRKLLAGVVEVGYIDVIDNGSNVLLHFLNLDGVTRFILTLEKQIVFTQSYASRVQLCTGNLKAFQTVNLGACSFIRKLGKALTGIVSVNKGIAALDVGNYKIYKEIAGTSLNFCITGKAMSQLLHVSEQVINAQDLLIAIRNGMCYAAVKCRGAVNDDIVYAMAAKAKYKATINLSNLYAIIKNIKLADDMISLDFGTRQICVKTGGYKFSIPLMVVTEQAAPNVPLQTLTIPIEVVKLFINSKTEMLSVEMKRNFNVLEGATYSLII